MTALLDQVHGTTFRVDTSVGGQMGTRVDAAEAVRVMKAAGLRPLTPFPGANESWRCLHLLCGREISTSYSNVRKRGSACRQCAAERRGAQRRAGLASEAVAVMERAGFRPLVEYPGADKPWPAVHLECGEERRPTLNQIRSRGTGCRPCSYRAIGRRTWTPESAGHAFRDAGLEPLEPYPGASTTPWRARHLPCGSIVSPRLGNIAAGQGPCDVCGRIQQAATNRNDDEASQSIMRAHGLEPQVPYPGVDAPWLSVHVPCGREVSPNLSNVRKGQSGCIYCTHDALAERFRMPEAEAVAVMVAADLTPLEPYPGSNRRWACHHTCGKEVTPTLGNVKQGNGICRYCHSAFPYDGPAIIYLVSNASAHKIGIAGRQSGRLEEHRRGGWSFTWAVEVPTGDIAYNAEQSVLNWWRNELSLPSAHPTASMPQGGATETCSRDGVDAGQVLRFVEEHLLREGIAPAVVRVGVERPTLF